MEKAGKKRTKAGIGVILMTFGLLLIAAAGGLFAYNARNDRIAGEKADMIIKAVADSKDDSFVEVEENGERTAEIDGEKYIGVISIPSLGISLPVQSEWSLEKLKTSPCRYSGDLTDGSLIICAHNYQSHFGNLKYASVGDKVIFTDVMGLNYYFEVISTSRIDGYDSEGMKHDDGWDMTLFTCTYSGRQRQTLRLIRVQNDA
ncbi:MAG: sortase [Clostridia bacterium]|nr:sortase [Clostridia bacterium]